MTTKTKAPWWEQYKVDLPEGESGDVRIERMTVEADDRALQLHNLQASMHPGGRTMSPGVYTRLVEGRKMWMSDTRQEIMDHTAPIHRAERFARSGTLASALINGLGIGVVLGAVMRSGGVSRVRVIERHPDVIRLVAPTYDLLAEELGVELEIVEADALEYTAPRGERFDIVWHDIWLDINGDNAETMGKLHRKYGRRADWQGSWARAEVQYANRQWREQERTWGRWR